MDSTHWSSSRYEMGMKICIRTLHYHLRYGIVDRIDISQEVINNLNHYTNFQHCI